eukprot:COSAG05_NODE_2757_length_2675_cov_11.625090_1_plen_252_part_00
MCDVRRDNLQIVRRRLQGEGYSIDFMSRARSNSPSRAETAEIAQALGLSHELILSIAGEVDIAAVGSAFVTEWRSASRPRGSDGDAGITAFCSFCNEWGLHRVKSKGMIGSLRSPTTLIPGSRERYECQNARCGNSTLTCDNFDVCAGMTRGGIWDDSTCAVCSGKCRHWPWNKLPAAKQLAPKGVATIQAKEDALNQQIARLKYELRTKRSALSAAQEKEEKELQSSQRDQSDIQDLINELDQAHIGLAL